jgi:hypothetical protein
MLFAFYKESSTLAQCFVQLTMDTLFPFFLTCSSAGTKSASPITATAQSYAPLQLVRFELFEDHFTRKIIVAKSRKREIFEVFKVNCSMSYRNQIQKSIQ